VKVKVLEVDAARKRISLTMKTGAPVPAAGGRDNRYEGAARGQRPPRQETLGTAMAGAFSKLQGLRKPGA
jgi:uncharacterized protein